MGNLFCHKKKKKKKKNLILFFVFLKFSMGDIYFVPPVMFAYHGFSTRINHLSFGLDLIFFVCTVFFFFFFCKGHTSGYRISYVNRIYGAGVAPNNSLSIFSYDSPSKSCRLSPGVTISSISSDVYIGNLEHM